MREKPKVVILGGGYGGVRAALELAKTHKVQVFVVDKNSYHTLPAQYYELGTLFREEEKLATREEFHKYFYTAAVAFADIFRRCPDISFIKGEPDQVFPHHGLVVLKGGHKLHYDWLVLALGSQTNYFDIPHLENNAIGFKQIEEVLNIRNRIDELFLQTPKRKKITVVVGGGGVTGTELAGELVRYMRKLAHIHARPVGAWSCIIVEASATILGTSHPLIQKKARKRLTDLGVTLIFSSPIVDVWPNLLYIGKERRTLGFDLLVWTAGVKGACHGSIFAGIPVERRDCVMVAPTLQVEPFANIFSVGDIAASVDPKTHTPIPMTAQKAVWEGKYVAQAILKLIKNSTIALPPYKPKRPSFIIPIGGKYALLETPHFTSSGFWVWCLKYLVLARYLFSILPISKALGLLANELRLYTKND